MNSSAREGFSYPAAWAAEEEEGEQTKSGF
jgi:hypothetical protein